MAENTSFRSAFKGFNREDVVGYIAGLMDKIASAEKEAAALKGQLSEKETECGALREQLEQTQADHAALEEKYAALEQQSEELESKCREYDKQARANEEKLGAAMLEAKRFSEMLVQEANDRACEVYRSAYETVSVSADSARAIEAKMKTLSDEFDSAMGDLRRTMRELIGNMSKFKESVQDNGTKYTYHSEFSDNADE